MKRNTLDRFIVTVALLTTMVVFAPGISLAHPAKKVVDMIWDHLGGKETFERARYVQFTFSVVVDGTDRGSRRHTWDRYTGDYILRSTDRKTGNEMRILFNIETQKGTALRNDTPVKGEEAARLIEDAYGAFINDTYWLLVPTKLEDYGARITFTGHEGVGEEENQLIVLHLFFNNVGLTPGDKYWLYVDHHGQIKRWRFVLESGNEGEFNWLDEKDCGMGLKFSTTRTSDDGQTSIVFTDVRFSETMDRSVFEYAAGE